MRYLVEIRTDNAAFDGDLRPSEVALILCKLADGINEDSSYGPILDSNGNTVGYGGWKE